MQKGASNFQTILLIIFIAGFVIGVIIFSGLIELPSRSDDPEVSLSGTVFIWGTLPINTVQSAIASVNANPDLRIIYREFSKEEFDQELVEAIASAQGPDMIILSDDMILRHEDKIVLLPYESFPLRNFQETYTQVANAYLTPEGVLGFPLAVDPIVMYYNRDILESSGYPFPPKTWEEVIEYVSRITTRDASRNIRQSGVALGEYTNINNAQEIISALLLQVGNTIVTRDSEGNAVSTLYPNNNDLIKSSESVLDFYTSFSDPSKEAYSWNRSWPLSQDAFVAQDLALYFGFASELDTIRRKNLNLNFDVAPIPQLSLESTAITFGHTTAFAVLKTSHDPNLSFQVARMMAGPDFGRSLTTAFSLSPVHRVLVAEHVQDPYQALFLRIALQARTWASPGRSQTDELFRQMIENINSGRLTLNESLRDTHERLNLMLP